MSFVDIPFMLIFGFFFLRLFGQGSMTLIPNTLIPQWFVSRRGIALSLMAIGGALASASFPPINDFLITNLGIEHAWRVWALLLVGVMVPLGLIFVRDKPEQIGEVPDGEKGEIQENNEKLSAEISWSLSEAKTTKVFWVMLFIMAVPAMVNTGLVFHMVSIIEGKGHSSSFGAFILSVFAIAQLITTFLAGYILDRTRVNVAKGVNFIVSYHYEPNITSTNSMASSFI
ncbi:MFS transporter [Natranaerobius trueperi]|uniref:MFS transporter n=1 Tax=Natranaerobius trueperi TaxID=759412 RepID=UPI00197BC5F3|nr:MFS transporter [Natranaerobius trueperi]